MAKKRPQTPKEKGRKIKKQKRKIEVEKTNKGVIVKVDQKK